MASRRERAHSERMPEIGLGVSHVHDPDPGGVVTMQDIATAAGVSLSTVSRVINKSPSRVPIAPGTRERIERETLRLGYRPNPFARALRGAPTMLLGVVVRDFSDPFFAGALEALTVEAMARGYNVVLGHAQGPEDGGFSLTSVIAPRHCDAVIVLGEMEDQPRLLAELSDAKEPIVALWQGSSPTRFPTVDVDDRKGIVLGLEHLVRRGHRRIGFVSARLPGGNPTREDSYVEFMRSRFGGVPDGYLVRCESTLAEGVRALETMLRLPQTPTAIACATDVAAVGVLHGAHSHGVIVPDGLSVVGYDDLMLAAYTIPALTTLRMPTNEIVAEAVRTAIDRVRDRSLPQSPSKTVFNPKLIVRASTAPPPP